MVSVFNRLSKWFIHPTIQKDELQFTKAKALLILLLFFLVVLFTYTAFFIYHDVLYNFKAFLNYLGLFVISLSLFMLKRSQKLKSPIRVINYASIGLVTGGVYMSGGFASNDILWYMVTAVSSLLFIGKVDGIIMTCVSLLGVLGFYLIDIMDLVELPYDELTRSIHYRFINAVIIITILFFLMWVLVKRNDRLQIQIREIQNSQVRESISQDFHDELGNKLASIVHLSKRLKDSPNATESKEMLDIVEKESQQVYENFRDFIWANEPNSLNLTSLYIYLTDFNQQFFAHKEVQVEGELITEDETLETKISSSIIRQTVPLFKELMTNIYKHANAKRVDWSVEITDGQLILKIADDGDGFEVNDQSQGRGLKSINKRVTQLEADYKITSEIGNGTSVLVGVPLNNNEPNE